MNREYYIVEEEFKDGFGGYHAKKGQILYKEKGASNLYDESGTRVTMLRSVNGNKTRKYEDKLVEAEEF